MDQAPMTWIILVNHISHKALAELVLATGSPGKGWPDYAFQAAAEKARLTQSWHSLRMKDEETSNEYFSRDC